MAINLNANQYGAQFSAFVKFVSEQKNQDFIARIEKQKPELNNLIDPDNPGKLVGPAGQARTIVAKSWDGCGQVLRGKGSRKVNNEVRDLFLKTILGVCGVKKVEDLPPSVQAVLKAGDFNGKGHPLTVRRIKAVTQAVQDSLGLTEAVGAFVSGSSPAVAKFQHIVMTAPCVPADAEPVEKMAAFGAKLSENTAKELVISVPHLVYENFVNNGEMDFTRNHQQFFKDHGRDMKVYIGKRKGGDEGTIEGREEISRDYETARDELVRFITGNKGDTFEAASKSVKIQTGLLMSLLNQCTSMAIMRAFQSTIEREGVLYQLADYNGSKAGTNMDFTLTRKMNPLTGKMDGDIQITFAQNNGCGVLVLSDENGSKPFYMNSETSCCHVGLELTLSADRLKSVGEGDWTKMDFKAFEDEKDIDNQIALIPEGLRLNPFVTASAHFELNSGSLPEGMEAPKKVKQDDVIKA